MEEERFDDFPIYELQDELVADQSRDIGTQGRHEDAYSRPTTPAPTTMISFGRPTKSARWSVSTMRWLSKGMPGL